MKQREEIKVNYDVSWSDYHKFLPVLRYNYLSKEGKSFAEEEGGDHEFEILSDLEKMERSRRGSIVWE